ncbi:MAG TPA: chromosome segregation SMC family protein [Nitrososphaeraceae archaeon]|nr:chromosome segregation SMC family protein [Nitrososphaeraceae archaeon]
MHIKKLEVYGFKSFGFKNSVLTFDKGLIAVTGPNGSGKSNILDAIMFALGENSPKVLRVDRFQSLFHDSQNTHHKMIHVSLTFDNHDRGIPIDSDNVTLTRDMEGQAGESEYYLNGKKVTKGTIVELLEIVIATSNKLNIVQQGMITRISELNSDERRRIIEDIIGLSYFDEKKTEALKQLDESDRRLEVAFARIDEVRKRIDELEIERNEQMKFLGIENEIKKYRAIKISNAIVSTRLKTESIENRLESSNSRSMALEDEISQLNSQIERTEQERAKYMKELDITNKDKALVEGKLSNIVYESERNRAVLKEADQRIINIERRLKSIELEKVTLENKLSGSRMELEKVEKSTQLKRSEIGDLTSELNSTNSKIDKIASTEGVYHTKKVSIEGRLNVLLRIQSQFEAVVARLEERRAQIQRSIDSTNADVLLQRNQISRFSILNHLQDKDLQIYLQHLQSCNNSAENLLDTKKRVEQDLSTSSRLVVTAQHAVSHKFDDFTQVLRNPNTEYFAISRLLEASEYLGIVGLVQDLIKFERVYERAILAAASDWMRAIVVSDIQSMISLFRYSMNKKLSRFKIIPLDILKYHTRNSEIERLYETDSVGVLGSLDRFVTSAYSQLVTFLFRDIVLVRTSSTGYELARRGFKSVSLAGISFEPSGVQVSIDFGTKIFDVSKTALTTEIVRKLESSTRHLTSLVEMKRSNLEGLTNDLAKLEQLEFKAETNVTSLHERISSVKESISATKELLRTRIDESMKLREKWESTYKMQLVFEARLSQSRSLMSKLAMLSEKIDKLYGSGEFASLQSEKSKVTRAIEKTDLELREKITESTPIRSMVHEIQQKIKEVYEEEKQLLDESQQIHNESDEMRKNLNIVDSEILTLRQKEQDIIDSTGKSYEIVSEYEQKIKMTRDNERKLSREYSTLDRDIAISRRDIEQLGVKYEELTAELKSLNYEEMPQDLDVDIILENLNAEYDSIRNRVNLRANDAYSEIVEGYRSMSERRNELEIERNSIVEFIEEIAKERSQVFDDAFSKVDQSIRQTFAEVTGGGSAWLEIENPAEETSGIMLVVQFPDKPRRESTSLSGGEKTMAATIFLLALQSLKPSPFYLMDEVDAHLDAQNTERLLSVLLRRSINNQIIMVTLKDSTVAKAGLVYGVYPKEGVSHVVRYNHGKKISPSLQSNP